MKKALKRATALMLAGVMSMQLVACGTATSSSSSSGSETSSTTATGESSGEQVTLTMSWWGGDSRHELTQQAIALFEEKYPYITVETQYGAFSGWQEQLGVQLAGGQEPDVMQINWSWIYTYSPDGNSFTDLNQYSDIIDLEQFDNSLLEQMSIDGKLQGIPIATTGKVFYWNKTTFDLAGIDIPTSFEEMIAAGHTFQEVLGDDYYPLALTPWEQFLLMVYYLQNKYSKAFVENGQVNYTTEEVADGISFISTLEENHVLPSQMKVNGDGANEMDQNSNWISGKYAGFYEWDSSATKFADALAEGQEMVIGQYPQDYSDTPSATSRIAMAWAMSDTCEHPEEAALLINFLLNDPDAATILGTDRGVPSSQAALEVLEEKGLLTGLTYESNQLAVENTSFTFDPFLEDTSLRDTSNGLYYDVFEGLSYDHLDPTSLAQELVDGINAVLSANYGN